VGKNEIYRRDWSWTGHGEAAERNKFIKAERQKDRIEARFLEQGAEKGLKIPLFIEYYHASSPRRKPGSRDLRMKSATSKKPLDSDFRRNDKIAGRFEALFPPADTFSAPCQGIFSIGPQRKAEETEREFLQLSLSL